MSSKRPTAVLPTYAAMATPLTCGYKRLCTDLEGGAADRSHALMASALSIAMPR